MGAEGRVMILSLRQRSPPKPSSKGLRLTLQGLLSRKRSFRYPSAREKAAALGGPGL